MNREQLRRFEAARARLPKAPASLANSSGIFLGPDFHFDLARPGAALYGLAPVAGAANPMRPVVRLQAGSCRPARSPPARPSATAQAGERRAAAHRDRRGRLCRRLPRSLGNRGTAFAGDTAVPLVGIVSMDTATFDVTDAPQAVEGGFLELIGPKNPVDALAAEAGTIGYEILTALGGRFARAYADAAQIERLTA